MKRRSLALSLVFTAAVVMANPRTGLSQTARENNEHRALFNMGVTFQHEGNFLEAEKKFREALRRFPRAEQADQTAYYLIDTLVKLRRTQEARTETENFRRNYPQSKWLPDVDEKILQLGGQTNLTPESGIWNSPAERREAQARADLLRGAITPDGPPNQIYSDNFPINASRQAVLLRQIIQMDRDEGIKSAQELLRMNPSDQAVAANLGTIANSDSPLALPFLMSVWGNTAASPNIRNNAFYWFSRRSPEKEAVAKAIMDLMAKPQTQGVGSEALRGMTVADHRAVLDKIVNSSNPEKFSVMEKIYRGGSPLLRTDLLMFISMLNDSRAVPFLVNAAQNDMDASVRGAAAKALGNRKDVDVATLERILKSTPPAPPATGRGQQPSKFAQPGGSGPLPFLPPVLPPAILPASN